MKDKHPRVCGEHEFRELGNPVSLGIHIEIQDSAEIVQPYVPGPRHSFVGHVGPEKVLVLQVVRLRVLRKVFFVEARPSILHNKEKLSEPVSLHPREPYPGLTVLVGLLNLLKYLRCPGFELRKFLFHVFLAFNGISDILVHVLLAEPTRHW